MGQSPRDGELFLISLPLVNHLQLSFFSENADVRSCNNTGYHRSSALRSRRLQVRLLSGTLARFEGSGRAQAMRISNQRGRNELVIQLARLNVRANLISEDFPRGR